MGEINVKGLEISGTLNRATAQNWNPSEDLTGYFVGLHLQNVAKVYTPTRKEGKALASEDDLLLFVSDGVSVLPWVEFEDTDGKKDRYKIDVKLNK